MAAGPPDGSGTAPTAAVVRLRDVARVELGAQNYNQSCLFDGRPSVGLAVYQLPGTNALDVADAVRKKMEELKTRFPDGVDYDIGYDTTPFIRESISDVVHTMFEAVVLVGLVVLIFLQDWRAMILPMIDVPVSIIGTFAVMAVRGLQPEQHLAVRPGAGHRHRRGRRHRGAGEHRADDGHAATTSATATIKAMEEVTGPIIAVALVLCAVFVPCAFISGITGRFFRQFAVTIAVSTLISAINAVTMTPSRACCFSRPRRRVRGTKCAGRPCRGGSSASSAGSWRCGGERSGSRLRWRTCRAGCGRWRWNGPAVDCRPRVWRLSRLQAAAMFAVGAVAGGAVGWSVIRPVERRAGLGRSAASIAVSTGSPASTAGRWADCSASAWWCWRSTACCWS